MIDGLQSISDKLATPQKKLFDSVMQKDADLLAKAQLKDYKVAPRISAKDQDLLRFTGPNVMGFLMINNTLKALMKQTEGFYGQGASSKKRGAETEGFSFSDVAEEALGEGLASLLGKYAIPAVTSMLANSAVISALGAAASILLPGLLAAAALGAVGAGIEKFSEWAEKKDTEREATYLSAHPEELKKAVEKKKERDSHYFSEDYLAPETVLKYDSNRSIVYVKDKDGTEKIGQGFTADTAAALMDRLYSKGVLQNQKGFEKYNPEWKRLKKLEAWQKFMSAQDNQTYKFHSGGYVPGNKSQEVEAVLLGGERVLSHKELDAFSSYIQEERKTLSEAFSLYTQTPFEVNVPEQKPASINPTIVTEVDTNAIRRALLGGMDSYSTIAREELSSGFDQLAKQFSMQEFIEASKLIKEAALHLKEMQLPASQNTIQPVVVKSEPQAFNPPVRSRR